MVDNDWDQKIKVLFENENFMVVDKGPGISTTNENGREIESLEQWLEVTYKNIDIQRQGIVHRLDKGTSGLVLVAKNQTYLEYLKNLFKKRLVAKKYLALIGNEVVGSGKIDMPIDRSQKFFGRFGVSDQGKRAVTEFVRIGVFVYKKKKYSLVEVTTKTGRTHQIRVHFKYLGWPLIGDRIYGGEDLLNRPFLQASYLGFEDMNGKKYEFRSDLATDLKQLLDRIKNDQD